MSATMFAGGADREGLFLHVHGDPRTVRAFGVAEPVEVTVTEDPEGPYYGWVKTGKTEFGLVQPHRGLYRMQFSPPPEYLEERGQGRTVRLVIEPVAAPSD